MTGLKLFDHPNMRAMNKLFAMKVLQNPLLPQSSVFKSKASTVYSADSINSQEYIPVNSKFWSSGFTRLFDFASGPSSTSVDFIPYVKEIVGVDISQDMAHAYNDKAKHLGVSGKLKGYCLDIASEDFPGVADFDAAVCCMAYHHLPDTELITKRVVSLLKPAGWYFVMDFHSSGEKPASEGHKHRHGRVDDHDTSFHVVGDEEAARHGIAHRHGIGIDRLVESFELAGLVNIGIEEGYCVQFWFTESDGGLSLKIRIFKMSDPKSDPMEKYCMRWNWH